MTEIETMIEDGSFYGSGIWKRKREKVLRADRWECQRCKRLGRFKRGYIVHHIKHLEDRPDLALEMYDPDTGERQLETVCKECHEWYHPEAFRQKGARKREEITPERWD